MVSLCCAGLERLRGDCGVDHASLLARILAEVGPMFLRAADNFGPPFDKRG